MSNPESAIPAAAQAPAVPAGCVLTQAAIDSIMHGCWDGPGLGARFDRDKFARAIEAAVLAAAPQPAEAQAPAVPAIHEAGPLPPHRKITAFGRVWIEEDLIAYGKQERAAERMLCQDLVSRLTAAPQPAPVAQWQPIETAPRESLYEDGANRYGQHILVWANGYDAPLRARWWYRADSDAKNFIADGGLAVFPSRWQPLPAAPEQEQQP